MGRMIEAVCARREDVQIAGFVGQGGCASLDELEEMDAALDFSHPDNLNGLLESAARRKIPLVIGTTGFSDAQGEAIREAGRSIPIVWADNFSVGVTVLGRLAAEAARMLGGGFDMEIVETHHRCKADAPSGTALLLADAVKARRPDAAYVFGRAGHHPRQPNEIGIHSLRMGNVVGEHEVIFATDNQTITLKHQAHDRALFAEGALAAADFLQGQPAGLYHMEDLLGP